MTFVGTRPEVPKYVAHYTEEMMATFCSQQVLLREQVLNIRMKTAYLKMQKMQMKYI